MPDVSVEKALGISPTTVQIPVGNEVETVLQYPSATSSQVLAQDGILAHIDQQKDSVGVMSLYVTMRRSNCFTFEGDAHVTKTAVLMHVPRRPVLIHVFCTEYR